MTGQEDLVRRKKRIKIIKLTERKTEKEERQWDNKRQRTIEKLRKTEEDNERAKDVKKI